MADPTKEDLDAVFVGAEGPAPDVAAIQVPDEDAEAEREDAENAAIDEMFAAEDPVARREAFKRAVQLCMERGY
jgi:hypothetical protein